MADGVSRDFVIALTADFFGADGAVQFQDVGLSLLAPHPGIRTRAMNQLHPVVRPEQLSGAKAAILMESGADRQTVADSDSLLALARFGVGYNDIDVQACTDADILFFTAAGSVDRSMAEATLGWMIALGHHFRMKDILVRTGRWDHAPQFVGMELRERTFGAVGLGGIARATISLLSGLGMATPLAFDPYVDAALAAQLGVELVSLDELMRRSDFISIHCPLNDATRDLIGQHELALMKPSAFLINTARGGIVDEDALFDALASKRIAGSALDVFVGEPFTKPHRFGTLDNTLLAPHAVGLTHEMYRDIGRSVCQGMLDLAQGVVPQSVINPEVLARKSFQDKWARLRLR